MQEHPDIEWNDFAVLVNVSDVKNLHNILGALARARTKVMFRSFILC